MQNRMSGKMATLKTLATPMYHIGSALEKTAYVVSPTNMKKTIAAQIMTLSGVNQTTKQATMKDQRSVKVNRRM